MQTVHSRVYRQLEQCDSPFAGEALELITSLEAVGGLNHRVYYGASTSSPEERNQHFELVRQIQSFQRYHENEPLDHNLHSFLIMLGIFSTSSLVLKNPEALDAIQSKYAMLLFRYLKAKLKDKAYDKFTQGLMMTEVTKKAYGLHCKMVII